MDGSDPDIVLDERGVCNHCYSAKKELDMAEREKHNLPFILDKITNDGRKKKYDVLIGLSGGVDSSVALHHVVRLGLRPLCFSVDNGYNDPKADENIMRLVEGLKVPFFRYTIDLKKFKELQASFLRAGLINVEATTDHILMATSLELASQYDIKWIISGGNVATESIMPHAWSYPARDLKHIEAVYKWATGKKLTGLPVCGLLKWNWYKWIKGIRTFYLLDYLDYNRMDSIIMLQQKYGWQDYYEKHCESTFTWWFQSFYLFEKFGIDKRKAHLSSLINSGQITRAQAMQLTSMNPVYPRLGIEKTVMKYPKRSHYDFPTDEKRFNFISKILRKIPRKWRS